MQFFDDRSTSSFDILGYIRRAQRMGLWEPYLDTTEPATLSRIYVSQPAYAVSSFMSPVKLMRVGAEVTKLHGIETVG